MNEEVQAALDTANAVNNEFFYWVSIALMVLIHAGFLFYESGASRVKNVLATAMKNVMTLPVVIASFFFFGWFIYNAFPTGPPELNDLAKAALPWSENMGPNLADPLSGVFWGAFALFSATTASIVSGACIERIRLSGFLVLAVVVGSIAWVIAAAWGWHPSGWLTTELGFHDAGAAGVVHVVSGCFALGVLLNLGPRIGKYVHGKPVTIAGHSMPMSMLGLFLIFVGFFGFLMGCTIYSQTGYVTIYGQPMNLSAFVFNTLMGLAGGMIGAYLSSRAEPFWTVSGGLAGVISVAAGLDVYHPALAFVIAIVGGFAIPKVGAFVERRGIDDPVGAVSVHGFCGAWSLLAMGIFAAGYPNVGGLPDTSLVGQIVGLLVCAALGFGFGWGASKVLSLFGMLRTPPEVEVLGLDLTEIPATPYPEGMPVTVMRNGHGVVPATVSQLEPTKEPA
jgi:ammonium transporter, Amt family